MSNTGVLLVNLGTPAAPNVKSVRRYLKQFLSDPRVIELPYILRMLLLYGFILPLRAKKSTHAYASIWQDDGSPLLINSKLITVALQEHLGSAYTVALGMRYGQPSIAAGLNELFAAKVARIVVVPLFPQYSSAANGSALEVVLRIMAGRKEIPAFTVINDFFAEPGYIQALVQSFKDYINKDSFLLMSYHGLPERQLINPGISCYKTKCLATSNLIAQQLQMPDANWAVSFQSRLGRLPWIRPYTDEMLIELRSKGITNLAVACPSFVADCLETLEEINLRAREQWLDLGGKEFTFIPCLNADAKWIKALGQMITNTAV